MQQQGLRSSGAAFRSRFMQRPARLRSVQTSAFFKMPALPFLQPPANKATLRAERKEQLLALIEPTSRGLTASPEQVAEIDAAASALEALNPTPKPLASPLLNGKWRLVYTTSASILGTNKPAPFRPSGPIYQLLDNQSLTARNQETAPFYNSVRAELRPLDDSRVAVQFKVFKIFNLISINSPPSAKGELDITYLDEEMRVSRGDKGNLFVLLMDDRDERP